MKKIFMMLLLITFALSAACQAEEAAKANPAAAQSMPQPAAKEASQVQELSIYGEVQAVNPQAGSIKVQYYDYDTDEEKPVDIISGKDTKIENAATLNDIKQGDWVDVVYSVAEGKNIATTIIVEKAEPPADEDQAGAIEEE